MKAIHVNWTAPFFEKHRLRGHGFEIMRDLPPEVYDVPDYQALFTILSALRWKIHNGPIKLYTDSIGLSFYQQLGIASLYDEIDIKFLNDLKDVDPASFWTSGKIQALGNENVPFTFIDQDFIIRDTIPESFYSGDVGIGHWEIPRGSFYYFDKAQWEREITHMPFPPGYNYRAYAPNTSLLYFSNDGALKRYVDWHKKMIDTTEEIPVWYWLATDQGILGHVIREYNFNTTTLTDKVFLPDGDNGNRDTRPIGLSEPWYWPMEADREKDIEWEHVWLAKIVYGKDPDFMHRESQRYFDEIWAFGGKQYLMHHRFTKYWSRERHGK
jgi:hypothetical protein